MFLKHINKKVKEHDLFGHQVTLNFNQNGDTHTTFIGGIFSILIKTAMTVYIFINVIKLVYFDGDTINTTILKMDLDKAGPIVYDSNNQLVFWSLRSSKGSSKPLMLDDPKFQKNSKDKILPYLSVEILQEHVDWSFFKKDESKFKTYNQAQVRKCVEKDFCVGLECQDYMKRLFKDWDGLSIVCPEMTSLTSLKGESSDTRPRRETIDDGFKIQGDPSKMVQDSLVFSMKQCQGQYNEDGSSKEDEKGWKCPEQKDLDSFMKSVTVEVWTIHEKINFEKRFSRPVYHTIEFKSQSKVNTGILQETQIYQRDNVVFSTEKMIQITDSDADDYHFIDIDNIKSKEYDVSVNDDIEQLKGSVILTRMYRDSSQIIHERRIYSIIDLMGDLGGVMEIVMVAFGTFMYGISEHSFYTRAIKKFYKVKTSENKLFQVKNRSATKTKDEIEMQALPIPNVQLNEEGNVLSKFTSHIQNSQAKYKIARITTWQSVKLYFENWYSGFGDGVLYCACFGRERKSSKLQKLFEIGSERIEEELDITLVLKKLKNLDILVKKFLTDDHQKNKAQYDKSCYINIDTTSDEEVQTIVPAQTPKEQLKFVLFSPSNDLNKVKPNYSPQENGQSDDTINRLNGKTKESNDNNLPEIQNGQVNDPGNNGMHKWMDEIEDNNESAISIQLQNIEQKP